MTVTDDKNVGSPDIDAYEAMQLLESGDSQGAIKRCVDAIAHFGDNRNCFLVKARAHIEQEEYGFAEETLQNVLRLDPEHPAAWAMLGEVYYRLGKKVKVEYCKARLENIFPALTESLEVEPGESAERENTDSRELISEREPEPEQTDNKSIVPLEDIDGGLEEPMPLSDSSDEYGQDEPEFAAERVMEEISGTKNRTGGLRSELFETATFADICISQGKYEKALKIYSRLLQNEPENEKYKEKIKLIGEKWAENDGR